VSDLQRGFSKTLSKPEKDRLFDKLPEHVFWDVKVPLFNRPDMLINRFNPLKTYQYGSFLDFKYDDEYFFRRSMNPNTD